MKLIKKISLISTLPFAVLLSSYSHADTIVPLTVTKAELLFSDDFSKPLSQGEWSIKGKYKKAFSIENETLKGKELKGAGHGSTARKMIDESNFVLEFDVKFAGAKSFNLVLDDLKDKSVHAGHIARVVFRKNIFSVQDDKTGAMNHELRNQIKKHPQGKAAFKDLLDSKVHSVKYNFDDGQWHHVKIVKQGAVLQCEVGDKIAQLKSAGFAHPNLTQFGPTINGENIYFDNVNLWAIK